MSKKDYAIGTSGFSYREWRGDFYPTGLAVSEWLSFYARTYTTVEINNSFYRLPTIKMVQEWFDQTLLDFTFAVKMSRFVSHLKQLHMDRAGVEGVVHFFDSIRPLRQKLGVVLTQLPARMPRNDALLKNYIDVLKRYNRMVRLAIEFRHDSWFCNEVFDILHRNNVALVWNSGPPTMVFNLTQTADFIYVRFHGSTELYASEYTNSELQEWAQKINRADCAYVYFNNTMHAHALHNATTLKRLLA